MPFKELLEDLRGKAFGADHLPDGLKRAQKGSQDPRRQGILAGLMGKVSEASGRDDLTRSLIVGREGYGAALLGAGRADIIAVNVLLPFAAARANFTGQPELARKAFSLYASYPRLGTNSVESQMMAQLGMGRRLVNSARRQQGLLHLYKTLCAQDGCRHCPLGGAQDSSDSNSDRLLMRGQSAPGK